MDGQSLWVELNDKSEELNRELDNLRYWGKILANKECDYKRALAICILERREEGFPATLTENVCRGREDISDHRRKRDISEANYKASDQKIMILKLQIRIIESQMEAERRGI